jgi:glycosyltransferase involved in cell wall biosynthesis
MRILHLIPTLTVGGAEQMVSLLARRLQGLGHAVCVVSMYEPTGTSVEEALGRGGVELRFLGKRRGLDVRMVPRIAHAVRAFRPDVLHTHMYTLKYALPTLLARRGLRAVHTVHTVAESEETRAGRVIQRLAFRAGVVPVAIGSAVADSMRRVYAVPPPRTIPNGIPVSSCRPAPGARAEVRASLAIPPAAPVVVTVGRFAPAKNHAGLLDAFASERLRAAGAHLLLAGDGELRDQAERQVGALDLADRVHFLGMRSDVPRVLAAADVFALASAREGNPLSVMEAMAAGKPVVATAVGCLPELVPASAGRLVPPADPRALEAAMFELASNLTLARAMGEEAAAHARTRFDDSLTAAAYERLYRELA